MAPKPGGFFFSQPWRDNAGRELCFGFGWGTIADDTDVKVREKGALARFTLRYFRKTFMRCILKEQNPFYDAATHLSKGDLVLAGGRKVTTSYVNSSGERKEQFIFMVDFLIPAAAIVDSRSFAATIAGDGPPDPIESNEDYDYEDVI